MGLSGMIPDMCGLLHYNGNIVIGGQGIIFLPKLRVLLSPSRNGGIKVTLTTCMKLKLERVSVLFNSVLPRILLRHAEQFTKFCAKFFA